MLNRTFRLNAIAATAFLVAFDLPVVTAGERDFARAPAASVSPAAQGGFAASLATIKSKAPGQRAAEYLAILRGHPELSDTQQVELLSLAGDDALKSSFGTTLLPMISASYMALEFDVDAGEVFDKYLTLTLDDPEAALLLAEVYAGHSSLSILDWVIPPLETAAGAMRDPFKAAYTHVAISRLYARRGEMAEARLALGRANESLERIRDVGRAGLVQAAIAGAGTQIQSVPDRR